MIGGGNGDNNVTHVAGEDDWWDGRPGPAFTAHLLLGGRRAQPQTCIRVDCVQGFPDRTKILVIIVPGADVTVTEIANNVRRGPGDGNHALILLTGEAADQGGLT
jgi:hypothetical protein